MYYFTIIIHAYFKLSPPKVDTKELGESSKKDKKLAKIIPLFIVGRRGKVGWRKHEGL